MTVSRRTFLKSSTAALGMLALGPPLVLAETPASFTLRPGVFRKKIIPASDVETEVWGFNGSVPGPVLRYRQGERVRVVVKNDLPDETTVHWHGLRVPNAMDGVPQVTQAPIPVGGEFAYEFSVPDAGSYWYHPHQKSFEQVARGLYGAFIVEESRPIEADRELLWVLSDFKLGPDRKQVQDFGTIGDLANMGRLGNVITLNGQAAGRDSLLEVRSGERIRLRLLNSASARIFNLKFSGHQAKVIAYDGQPVEPHERPGGELLLGPGMRTDLVLDCMGPPGRSFPVVDTYNNGRELTRIVYRKGTPLRAKPMGAPIALSPNVLPEPDLDQASRNYILFEGGIAGKPVIGMVNGKPVPIQDIMSKHGLAWTMNYTARHEHALMHVPFLHLRQGEHCILSMVNQTGFEHPMHLHGHVFRVLAINGTPAKFREWRDTVLVGPRETVDIAFVADNPGEWMFHCHILEHAAGGMMGTIRVG